MDQSEDWTVDESPDQSKGIGDNFKRPERRQQYLSTKKVIWGREKSSSWAPDADAVGGYVPAGQHAGCVYCGFFGYGQEVDNLNDHHADVLPENLASVDHLCHAWHHLGEIAAGQGLMVFVPGLAPADVVHLQRTIFVALQTGTSEQREDAKALLNWLASHNQYVKDAWGTDQPQHFGLAMTANNVDPLARQYGPLRDVALVLNPGAVSELVSRWAQDSYRSIPRDEWNTRAQEVLRAAI
ncbi:hypothetical protein ACOTHA_29150 [Achromobacter xylosoxidans]